MSQHAFKPSFSEIQQLRAEVDALRKETHKLRAECEGFKRELRAHNAIERHAWEQILGRKYKGRMKDLRLWVKEKMMEQLRGNLRGIALERWALNRAVLLLCTA